MTQSSVYHESHVPCDDPELDRKQEGVETEPLLLGRDNPNWFIWALADAIGELTAAQQLHLADEAAIAAENALTELEDIPEDIYNGSVGLARAAASAIVADSDSAWDSTASGPLWSRDLHLRCQELVTALKAIYAEICPIPAMLDTERPQKAVRQAHTAEPIAPPAIVLRTKLHFPPRGLSREDAAAYVGVSPRKFDELVANGMMPKPIRIGGRVIWDHRALDRKFDALGDTVEDVDQWEDGA